MSLAEDVHKWKQHLSLCVPFPLRRTAMGRTLTAENNSDDQVQLVFLYNVFTVQFVQYVYSVEVYTHGIEQKHFFE